jgi:hypothetical protein
LDGTELAEAISEIERLAYRARRVVDASDVPDKQKRLFLLELSHECERAVFPLAARRAVWLAVGHYLYRRVARTDLERHREEWLRAMWMDEATRD